MQSLLSRQDTSSPCMYLGSGNAEWAQTMLMCRRWRCEHVVQKAPVQVLPAVSGELLKSLLQSQRIVGVTLNSAAPHSQSGSMSLVPGTGSPPTVLAYASEASWASLRPVHLLLSNHNSPGQNSLAECHPGPFPYATLSLPHLSPAKGNRGMCLVQLYIHMAQLVGI